MVTKASATALVCTKRARRPDKAAPAAPDPCLGEDVGPGLLLLPRLRPRGRRLLLLLTSAALPAPAAAPAAGEPSKAQAWPTKPPKTPVGLALELAAAGGPSFLPAALSEPDGHCRLGLTKGIPPGSGAGPRRGGGAREAAPARRSAPAALLLLLPPPENPSAPTALAALPETAGAPAVPASASFRRRASCNALWLFQFLVKHSWPQKKEVLPYLMHSGQHSRFCDTCPQPRHAMPVAACRPLKMQQPTPPTVHLGRTTAPRRRLVPRPTPLLWRQRPQQTRPPRRHPAQTPNAAASPPCGRPPHATSGRRRTRGRRMHLGGGGRARD